MFLPSGTRIYLAVGSTDMRKAINGLSILVQDELALDPLSGHLFAFCNRKRNMVKILYWDRNGFCLWHKRLEKHHFTWPRVGIRCSSWIPGSSIGFWRAGYRAFERP